MSAVQKPGRRFQSAIGLRLGSYNGHRRNVSIKIEARTLYNSSE